MCTVRHVLYVPFKQENLWIDSLCAALIPFPLQREHTGFDGEGALLFPLYNLNDTCFQAYFWDIKGSTSLSAHDTVRVYIEACI